MKYLLTLTLTTLVLMASAQKIKTLKPVSSNQTVKPDEGIIYGLFVQRLGFSSGGFPQDIRLKNTTTNQVYAMRVKPTLKSSKENVFSFHIPPGEYQILLYHWTKSKWYGGEVFVEPILKEIVEQELPIERAVFFSFSVQANAIHYVGVWDFETTNISFRNNKEVLDAELAAKFSNLHFSGAVVSIPQ